MRDAPKDRARRPTETLVELYRPRPLQAQLHKSLKRFNVLVAHRRFGKTVFCVNELIAKAVANPLERPRYAYVAPLFTQAKDVAWEYVKTQVAPIPGMGVNETELRVDLPGGARIRLYGADNPDRLRGLYLDGIVLDEYAQIHPRLWAEVVRPALADRQGWAIFINDQIARYNYAQQLPYNKLAQYMELIQGNYGGSQIATQPYDRDIGGALLGGASSAVGLGKEIFGDGLGPGGGLLSAGLGVLSAFL